MRFFTREPSPGVSGYTFTDGHFLELETDDEVAPVYTAGYLPASHLPQEPPRQFYRARSLRLDLEVLKFNKKRRYLQRQGDEAGLAWHPAEAGVLPPHWREEAVAWVGQRYHPPYMTSARLRYVESHRAFNQLAAVKRGDELLAVIVLPSHGECSHYWFAFLNHDRAPDLSLGRWCIGAAAAAEKQAGSRYLYLGTVYGLPAAYKFAGMTDGVEWFDGHRWQTDREALKTLLRDDPSPP